MILIDPPPGTATIGVEVENGNITVVYYDSKGFSIQIDIIDPPQPADPPLDPPPAPIPMDPNGPPSVRPDSDPCQDPDEIGIILPGEDGYPNIPNGGIA